MQEQHATPLSRLAGKVLRIVNDRSRALISTYLREATPEGWEKIRTIPVVCDIQRPTLSDAVSAASGSLPVEHWWPRMDAAGAEPPTSMQLARGLVYAADSWRAWAGRER